MTMSDTTHRARWDAERQRWERGPAVDPFEALAPAKAPNAGVVVLAAAAMAASLPYIPVSDTGPTVGRLGDTSPQRLWDGPGDTGPAPEGGTAGGGAGGSDGHDGPGTVGPAPDSGGTDAAEQDGGGGPDGGGSSPEAEEDAEDRERGGASDGAADDDGAVPSPSAEPSTESSADPSPGPEPEPAAFTLASLDGWERVDGDRGAVFHSPEEDGLSLEVAWADEGDPTPAEALDDAARTPLMEEAGYTEEHWAEWDEAEGWDVHRDGPHLEYTHDDGEPVRGLATAVVADNGVVYSLTALGPVDDADRAAIEQVLLDAVDGFATGDGQAR
ncbi:hypothetical protein [Nocardiopsis baichengensis]|uniref:hypothetical protein n=1 Tax=Nocardiopsis baichengensis TaxID=280240 RepID=UPI00034712C5|nr:hypothetical protein [Nocardiopsis baichengensis]